MARFPSKNAPKTYIMKKFVKELVPNSWQLSNAKGAKNLRVTEIRGKIWKLECCKSL